MQYLKRLFAKKVTTEPKTVIRYVEFPADKGMTLSIWREKSDLVDWIRRLWDDPMFQAWLNAVKSAAPQGWPVRDGTPIDPVRAALELGRKEGYQDCLNVMLVSAVHPQIPAQEIEPDYGAEIKED